MNDNTDNQCDPNHHGEIAVCFFRLLFAERFGDQCAAARAEHETDAAEDHDKRHDEVDGCKRRFADKVGDAETVHNAVDRGEDHHDDRRQNKAKQFFIGKMIGKLNSHLLHSSNHARI